MSEDVYCAVKEITSRPGWPSRTTLYQHRDEIRRRGTKVNEADVKKLRDKPRKGGPRYGNRTRRKKKGVYDAIIDQLTRNRRMLSKVAGHFHLVPANIAFRQDTILSEKELVGIDAATRAAGDDPSSYEPKESDLHSALFSEFIEMMPGETYEEKRESLEKLTRRVAERPWCKSRRDFKRRYFLAYRFLDQLQILKNETPNQSDLEAVREHERDLDELRHSVDEPECESDTAVQDQEQRKSIDYSDADPD